MFVVTFVIMLPIAAATGDPVKGWEAGLTWVFVQSFVLMGGAFIGPVIRRITPRAALLGTPAGVSIAFISMRPTMEIFYDGLALLGGGAIPGGLVLGAIAACIVDRNFTRAAGFALAGAALIFGFMHSEAIGIARTPLVALAYVLVAGWLYRCAKFVAVTRSAPAEELHGAVAAD